MERRIALDKHHLFSVVSPIVDCAGIVKTLQSGMPFRIALILTFFITSGCTSGGKHTPVSYETVTANPRRDTDAAVKQNQHGLEAFAKGKLEKAEKHFKDALIKDIDFGPAHNNLGRLYFDQGKNYLAAWEFEYAAKVMPHRGEPFNNLGLVMERVGKWEQAIDAYEMANILCPNNPEVVGNLARVRWSQNQSDVRVRYLLEQLVFIDSRSDWVSWAKEQIACGKISGETPVSAVPIQTTHTPPAIPVSPPLPPAPIPFPVLAPPIQK